MPHTELDESSIGCAYSQKIVKFVKMMSQRGHDCITYGTATAPPFVKEHVHLVDAPPQEANRMFDWNWTDGFKEFNERAIPEVAARASGTDFLCLTMGASHQPIADALPDLMAVETGIGYYGVSAKFRVFESYAWMAHVYGWRKEDNGRFYDAVINNYFDIDDFPRPTGGPDEYLFWMGRFVERKGPHVAVEIAERSGRKLIMAGQGVIENLGNKLVGAEVSIESDNIEHVGPVGVAERLLLMQNATAVIVPSLYIEPFGGVAAEALMAGCPVLSTDWGAFPEFVINYKNGFRFHTLKEAVKAVGWFDHLDRYQIQNEARKRFCLQSIGGQYEAYFERLSDLHGDGWYAY